jgi:S1-C subfamily serine protease
MGYSIPMRPGFVSAAKRRRPSRKSLWLAALLLVPFALEGQIPPTSRLPSSSRSGGAGRELSAGEIFKRFAKRIVFLRCDVSADEAYLASGVLVSDDGFVVTNAHVVEGCRTITATYIGGASRLSYEAKLKFYEKPTDTAVLKLPVQGMDHFELGPWAKYQPAQVGARVYAIGNPRGLEQSISEGIVSGNREQDGASWIQHSAPISPGSSGGALISSRGELLGINSFLLANSQNLNFAVPATTLMEALARARPLNGFLKFPPKPGSPISPGQVKAWREAAEQGNAEGAASLLKAAEQGDASAQLNLGVLYSEGHGVARDDAQAAEWIRKAAEQGDSEAQATLGAAYEVGQGVPKDYSQAAAWYRKAADQGYARAQNFLGYLYEAGRGVPQDYAEAAMWYRKAAAQGDPRSQYVLGGMYHNGHGVPQDYGQAAAWYQQAAERGFAPAQATLGVAYQLGEGVPQSYGESYFWLKVAEAGKPEVRPEDLALLLELIGARLTAMDLAQIQARAREWIATHQQSAR